ncbi:hypothetical protein Dip510_001374 [Elusimicrobium posterum]|uniref:hypothetical protein n=1 Tax=Elusimicrobium posterum TaxID=3116653 RepID=UPI003C712400
MNKIIKILIVLVIAAAGVDAYLIMNYNKNNSAPLKGANAADSKPAASNASGNFFAGLSFQNNNFLFRKAADDNNIYPDSQDTICDGNAYYFSLKSAIPARGQVWGIDSVNCPANADNSSIAGLFCKIIPAYEKEELEDILSLYRPEDKNKILSMLSKPEMVARYTAATKDIQRFDLEIVYEFAGAYIALVKVNEDPFLMPYYIVNEGGSIILAWLL